MDTILSIRNQLLKDTKFSFEYYNYIIVASFIALIGLITDSATTIIASMVISPVMNYVLALTFGVFLNDKKIVWSGILGIMQSLCICIIVGISGGLFFSKTLVLTNEILQRTDLRNVYWGIFIATLSGFATASSLVSNKSHNMIGIAISTSILPPAVNFGLLLPNSLWNLDNSVLLHKVTTSILLTCSNIISLFLSIIFMLFIYSFDFNKKESWITKVTSIRHLNLDEENQMDDSSQISTPNEHTIRYIP